MKKTIRFERQNAVGRIVLANPPRNLIDRQFSECLRQAVHDASESDIRVLVVQTEGPTSASVPTCGSGPIRM